MDQKVGPLWVLNYCPGGVSRREKSTGEVGVVAGGANWREKTVVAVAMGILSCLLIVDSILPQAVHSDAAEGIHQGRGEIQKQNEGKELDIGKSVCHVLVEKIKMIKGLTVVYLFVLPCPPWNVWLNWAMLECLHWWQDCHDFPELPDKPSLHFFNF